MTLVFPYPGAASQAEPDPIVPVILCGGFGSRLWPLSRREHAKQHVPIFGGSSSFQGTLARLEAGFFAKPIVIGSAESRFMIEDEAAEVGLGIELALEPEGRDTLAAVAVAACLAARRDPGAMVLAMPSDQVIPDARAFTACVAEAARLAACGQIVALGRQPTGPASDCGYIEPGALLAPGAHEVARYVHRPDGRRAAELVEKGWLWNLGMYCFRAEDCLAEIERHAPEALAAVQASLQRATSDRGALRLEATFRAAPRISFDEAVMVPTQRAAVVEVAFDWADISDWKTMWQHTPRDGSGVATEGKVCTRDVSDCYLRSDGRLLCVLGVEGLAVVDTADAVLVAPIERSHEVEALVHDMQAEGVPEACTPARVYRPWGWYQTMDLGERFRVKRILVKPGKKLSLQKHNHRAEHWVVVRGTAEVTRDAEVLLLRENESIYLPLGCTHRLANPGRIPVEIVEVQTGAYLEEDDIVRIADDFGRV